MKTIAVVTSWGSHCGISQYMRSLLGALPPGKYDPVILADTTALGPGGAPTVVRCWSRESEDVSGIVTALDRRTIDLLLVEFNWGYINPGALAVIIREATDRRIPTIVQLHSTDDRCIFG